MWLATCSGCRCLLQSVWVWQQLGASCSLLAGDQYWALEASLVIPVLDSPLVLLLWKAVYNNVCFHFYSYLLSILFDSVHIVWFCLWDVLDRCKLMQMWVCVDMPDWCYRCTRWNGVNGTKWTGLVNAVILFHTASKTAIKQNRTLFPAVYSLWS